MYVFDEDNAQNYFPKFIEKIKLNFYEFQREKDILNKFSFSEENEELEFIKESVA